MRTLKGISVVFIAILLSACSGTEGPLDGIKFIPVEKLSKKGGPGDTWIYLDLNGKQPFEGEFEYASFFSDGLALVKSKETDRFMFINEQGEMVIDASKYQKMSDFSNGIALGKKWDTPGDYVVAINTKGEEVFTIEGVVETLFNDNGMALYRKERYGNEYGFVNTKGETVDFDYAVAGPDEALLLSQGMVCVGDFFKHTYGAVNEKGELVIPLEYDQPFRFDANGAAVVKKKVDGRLLCGLINKKNEILIPPQYIALEPDGEMYIFMQESGNNGAYQYGWCDKSGHVLIEPKGELSRAFIPTETYFAGGEKACFLLSGGYSGDSHIYINRKGEEIAGFSPYILASPFLGGNKAAIGLKGKMGTLIDSKGNAVGEPFYCSHGSMYNELNLTLNYGYPLSRSGGNGSIMHD